MTQNLRLPPGHEWLKDIFTTEEICSLTAFYEDDGTFMCIGFIGPGGKTTQFAEPEKAQAIGTLEATYRSELEEMNL